MVVIISGSGLAAQFPSHTASEVPVVVALSPAQTDFEDTSPSLSLPQDRYASHAQATPSFAEPNERIERYSDPPAVNKERKPEDTPVPQGLPAPKIKMFELINDSGLEKTPLDLPLAGWNPLFDQAPPLSGRSLQPLIDDSALVSVQPEEVQTMKPTTEPFLPARIDSSQLVPVKKQEISVLISADSIVPADQDSP